MNWFVTKLCFEIASRPDSFQVEEQIRLVKADSEQEACKKAFTLGKKQEETILHISGEKVEWKFLGIRSLHRLTQLKDEEEIFSSVIVPEDISRYRKDLNLFSSDLDSKHNKLVFA